MPNHPSLGNSKHPFQKPHKRNYLRLLWAILILAVCANGFLKRHYTELTRLELKANPKLEKTRSSIILTGRYAVGAKTIYSSLGKLTVQGLSGNLIRQLKEYGKNNADRVSLVPLIGELAGQEGANKYLEELNRRTDLTPEQVKDLKLFQIIYQNGVDELDSYEQDRLFERHEWIGELALTFEMPFSNPVRKKVLKPAIRTFIVSFSFVGFILFIGVVGLVLLIIAIVMRGRGKVVTRFNQVNFSSPFKGTILLETMVIFFMVILFSNILSRHMPGIYFWSLYLFLIFSTFYFPIFRGIRFKFMKMVLGWHTGKGVLKEIGSGFVGYLTGLPLIIFGCLVSFMIMKFTSTQPIHPIVHQFRGAGFFKLVWLISLACILAPIIEESMFRGLFYQYLRFRHPVFISSTITGLFFAVIHPQGYAAIPALGMIGVVFALIREWRDSLIAPMIAHALNNFMITLLLVFTLAGRG